MSIERVSSNSALTYDTDIKVTKQPNALEKKSTPGIFEEFNSHALTKEMSKEDLNKVIKGMNDFLKPSNTSLKFEMHEELKEYYVRIIDNQTQEVVKEIPSKKVLDMYAAMTKFMGLLVDKKI